MICTSISQMLGINCHPLNEDGSVAMLETPFAFADGAELPIFVEKLANHVRFFDDGGVILHFLGRGLQFDDGRRARFIKNAADPFGVSLNQMGELEVWTSAQSAPEAFARYLSTLLAISAWEKEQAGVVPEISFLVDEVAFHLRAWKPNAQLIERPQYTGVSGQVYTLDLEFDGRPVVAIGTHPTTVSTATKKLVDVRAGDQAAASRVLIVLDDREDPEAAAKDALILNNLGEVMPMTSLTKMSGVTRLNS